MNKKPDMQTERKTRNFKRPIRDHETRSLHVKLSTVTKAKLYHIGLKQERSMAYLTEKGAEMLISEYEAEHGEIVINNGQEA
jgi:hypothetical protein